MKYGAFIEKNNLQPLKFYEKKFISVRKRLYYIFKETKNTYYRKTLFIAVIPTSMQQNNILRT